MPRRYGERVSIKDVCYEVLFQQTTPMHVRDIAAHARSLGLFRLAGLEAPHKSVHNTMATKMNNEIAKHGDTSRFERTGENTFALTRRETYEGRFRDLVAAAKSDRREKAVAAGEILPKHTEIPPIGEVSLTKLAQGTCSRPKWPQLSQREEELVATIEGMLQEWSFEWRIRASAALRQRSVEAAEAFLDELGRVK